MGATTLPQRQQSLSPKAPESVSTQGSWCCGSCSVAASLSSKRPQPKPKQLRNGDENTIKIKHKHDPGKQDKAPLRGDNRSNSTGQNSDNSNGYMRGKSAELNAPESLKSGEIVTLIKQGSLRTGASEKTTSSSPLRIQESPGRTSPSSELGTPSSMSRSLSDSSLRKLNAILNKSHLKPGRSGYSPDEKPTDAPTLFDMMVQEEEIQQKSSSIQPFQLRSSALSSKQPPIKEQILIPDSPGSQFNDSSSSDVKLVLTNRESTSVTVNLHRHILVSHSSFFSAKLSERWSKQASPPHLVEISDCEDIELYVETLKLMYSRDLKRKLMKEAVPKVLGILKVSAAIVFEAGVLSCLEYLEAMPWAEEDEEKVATVLSQLQLESIGAGEVLKRVSTENPTGSEDMLVCLLHLVTRATDEKARREMKKLVSRLLRENTSQIRETTDISKENFYRSCHTCLDLLLLLFMQASSSDFVNRANEDRGLLVAQIAHQVDNLHWLVDILIDRHIADEFVQMWAHQNELAALHNQIPAIFRHEVSRLTARLCIALGKGQVLATKEVRFMLLQNWLQPLIDDFAWMQRACRGLDRKVIEEGISQTILTLPLKQQQTIMLSWLDRFLNNGDNCPNLQRAFEIWWRRTFVRPYLEVEPASQSVEP
eukprot:c21283_g1_i1 orf=531-2486(+)